MNVGESEADGGDGIMAKIVLDVTFDGEDKDALAVL